jgi:hypothetical protein
MKQNIGGKGQDHMIVTEVDLEKGGDLAPGQKREGT